MLTGWRRIRQKHKNCPVLLTERQNLQQGSYITRSGIALSAIHMFGRLTLRMIKFFLLIFGTIYPKNGNGIVNAVLGISPVHLTLYVTAGLSRQPKRIRISVKKSSIGLQVLPRIRKLSSFKLLRTRDRETSILFRYSRQGKKKRPPACVVYKLRAEGLHQ